MTRSGAKTPFVAIACGGTGGHLFPGLAVAGELKKRGCQTALLISPKDIDQQAVKTARDVEIFTLPAVGLQNRNYFSFAGSFVKSLFAARKIFRRCQPDAVLAMGGFTSAPPVLAAKDVRRQDLSARIQHHSRPREPVPGAFRGRSVCRLSRNGFPVARAEKSPARARRCVRSFRWGETPSSPNSSNAAPRLALIPIAPPF